jgi:hypothetical protein
MRQNLFQIYAGFILAIIGVLLVWNTIKKPPVIATVNITAIVHEFVETQAKRRLPPDVLKKEVNRFATQLAPILNRIAKEHHVILLPQQAILAGAPDFTPLVKKHLHFNDVQKEGRLW